jgi:hypothetical protein
MSILDIVLAILKYGVSSVVLVILGMLIALHYQEKIQKLLVILWKVVRLVWKKAEKKIISNDIEGRINDFAKSLKQEMTNFEPVGVQIQWVEEGESPEQFFRDNRLIIRMREHQNQNKNFVYASMVFISKAVLTKAKKYISKTQKESIDLHIGRKLFEKEKPQVVDQFFEDFFSPKMESAKVAELVEKHGIVDKAGLFFPVLVQELTFLGEKVFWRRRDKRIIEEVAQFIDFLVDYSNREIGEERLRQNFEGCYCRCGIVIIAKALKREEGKIDRYTAYISKLIEKRLDNIYIIGPASQDNIRFIDRIATGIQQKEPLERYAERRYKAGIKVRGEAKEVQSYLLLLRNPNAIRYLDKEYQTKFIDPPLAE